MLLGVEGLAILRQLLRGEDEVVQARVKEVIELCSRLDEEPLSLSLSVPEMNPIEGYTAWAGTYDGGKNPLINLEEPVVRRIISELPRGRAIDVCCGTGRHTSFLMELGHEAVGVDATAAMLHKAHENIRHGAFVLGDATRLPIAVESADLVICALALTHFEDLTAPIAEFARVLRPGGRAVLSDLHPLIRAIGGGAFFGTKEGTFGLVREHLHLHSDYLDAFRAAALSVAECHEPVLDDETLAMMGFAHDFAPEAQSYSHKGLPFALVWDLVKS